MVNRSASEHFESLYRRLWGALNRPDAPDLSQHERQLLHHVPVAGAVSLTWLAEHLGVPKSTTSMVGKSLGQRGFVERPRDPQDEPRMAIALTEQGHARLAAGTALDSVRLAAAPAKLPPDAAGDAMQRLA